MNMTEEEKKKWAVRYFCDYLELSVEQCKKLSKLESYIDHYGIVKPFVILDLMSGQYSRDQLAIKYRVSPGKIRAEGQRIGVYKSYNQKKQTFVQGSKK